MERELDQNESLASLFEAITRVADRQECARFFRDLCTLAELRTLAERWEVAGLVAQGMTYRRISERTGASTATVTRVAHWVNHGEGGYRSLLRRMEPSGRGKPEAAVGTEKDG